MLNYQANYRIPFLGENVFVTMSVDFNLKNKKVMKSSSVLRLQIRNGNGFLSLRESQHPAGVIWHGSGKVTGAIQYCVSWGYGS